MDWNTGGTDASWMAAVQESERRGRLTAAMVGSNGIDIFQGGGGFSIVGTATVTNNAPSQGSPDTPNTSAPPFIVDLFVPLNRQDELCGDLLEMFNRRWVPKHGVRVAQLIHAAQALGSIVAIRITALLALIDWLMRHF
jgi:hypothetical protein